MLFSFNAPDASEFTTAVNTNCLKEKTNLLVCTHCKIVVRTCLRNCSKRADANIK